MRVSAIQMDMKLGEPEYNFAHAVELVRRGARQIVLGHLSKENNFPALAEKCCAAALEGDGVRLGEDATLCVAERDGMTGLFSVRMGFI